MADNNVGGISYDVDANVEGLLSSEKKAVKALDTVSKEFEKAGKANNKFDAQLKKTALAVKRQTDVIGMSADEIEIYDAVISGATAEQVKFIQQLQQTRKAANDSAGAMKKSTKAMAANNQKVTQLGYQVQDLTVQLQGGVSPFVAIAQQGSQAAGVLGPGGALFGAVLAISAAVGGTLFASFMKANSAMKEALENLDDMEQGFSDLTDAEKAYVALQTTKRISETQKSIDELNEKIDRNNAIVARNEKFVRKQGISAEKAGEKNTEYAAAVGSLQRELERLNDVQNELANGSTKKQEEQLLKLITALQSEADQLGFTSRQRAIYNAELLNATNQQKAQVNAIFDTIEAKEQEIAAEQKLAELRNQIAMMEGTQTQAGLDIQGLGLDPESEHARKIEMAYEEIEVIKAKQQAQREADQERQKMLDRYATTASATFEQTLAQTHSIEDATKAAARAVGQDMVRALIQYAAQWLVTQAMQIAGMKTSATVAAGTGATMTASYTPAAAAASVASFGGAAATGLASMAAAIPAMMALFTRGGRATGGVVQRGGMYKVTEHGVPETFRSPMGDFMIAPSNGKIERGGPNGGGDTSVMLSISVTQPAGAAPAQVQQSDQGAIITGAINAISAQISTGNGAVPQALRNNTTTQFKTRR